jgi:hypothetical protein
LKVVSAARARLDFADAILRRVLLDTGSLVEDNNVVPLPRVARE